MENLTLYRKYRPRKFSQVVGQEHIKQTLQNALKNREISHAYLFTGPRGTGKTTVARILAKVVNCENPKDGEPDLNCPSCKDIQEGRSLDLLEIDAASYTGVDNVREIRDKIRFAPAKAHYKVLIIDEVHMLSKSAFNALLKTLEEPPSHAIFVLATTEVHKVPETIISRCQRFDFRKLTVDEITKSLEIIAKKEKIRIGDDALSLIALNSSGSVRDAQSLLGLLISFGDKVVTLKEVKTFLGVTDFSAIRDLTEFLGKKDARNAIQLINELLNDGYNLEQFTQNFLNYLRKLLLLKINSDLKRIFKSEATKEQLETLEKQKEFFSLAELMQIIRIFIIAFQDLKNAFILQLPLEIAVAQICGEISAEKPSSPKAGSEDHQTQTKTNSAGSKNQPPKKLKNLKTEKSHPGGRRSLAKGLMAKNIKTEKVKNSKSKISFSKIIQTWNDILVKVRSANHSLAAFLKSSKPITVEDEYIILAAPYAFHKERIEDGGNKKIIEDVLSGILGKKVLVRCVLESDLKKMGLEIPRELNNNKEKSKEDLFNTAQEILGEL